MIELSRQALSTISPSYTIPRTPSPTPTASPHFPFHPSSRPSSLGTLSQTFKVIACTSPGIVQACDIFSKYHRTWRSTNGNRPVLRPLFCVPGRSLYAVVLGGTAVHPGIEVLSCQSCVKVYLARGYSPRASRTSCLVEFVLGVRLPGSQRPRHAVSAHWHGLHLVCVGVNLPFCRALWTVQWLVFCLCRWARDTGALRRALNLAGFSSLEPSRESLGSKWTR